MKAKTISFEELDKEHRQDRAEDSRRLALGLVTPDELQAENSLIPIDANIRIVDLAAYLKAAYDR